MVFWRPPVEVMLVEFAYFLIVAGLCVLIYRKAREFYVLSRHSGIFHFKNVFLFFALAYLFRLLHVGFSLSRELFSIDLPKIVSPISLFLVGYFSTMALLSLLMAVLVKYVKRAGSVRHSLHLFALVLAIVVFATRSVFVLMAVQFVLALVLMAVVVGRKLVSNRLNYFLMALIWIINVFVFSRRLIPPMLKIPLYLVSIGVFLWVFVRLQRIKDAK